MIEKLKKQRELLRASSNELLDLLGGDRPGDWNNLAQARWNLVRAHIHHGDAEDRLARRVLERDRRPRLVSNLSRLARQRQADLARFEDHMIRWTRARIERHWPAFTTDARQLLTSTAEHLDCKERDLSRW